MSSDNRRALEYLQVRGYYTTTYTQTVQPERIFAVTDYFRRYWVPLLKPGPAWLVVALRQRCFWNGQRDWCVVSRQTLAQESGVAIRTADNYLDLPLVDWFVTGRQPRYSRTRDGAKRRDWTHYDLRLDEPLIPAHQAALAAIASELAAACEAGDPTARALQIAQQLLDLDPNDLLLRLEKTTKDTKDAKVDCPLSVQEIIETAARPGSKADGERGKKLESKIAHLARACDALYTRIVRPDKVQIATQYFRLHWLPLLGAARAWLVLHLRARCYLSTHDLEVRDIARVAGLSELAAALGVSISTVKTCLSEPPAADFVTRLATRRPAAGQVEMSFRVEMIDPLTPADRQRYGGQPGLGDQQPDFAGSSLDQQPDLAASPPGQEPEFAAPGGQQPDFAARPEGQQPDFAGIDGAAKSQDLQDTKTQIITSRFMSTQQQVLIPAGQESAPLAAAAGSLAGILTHLGIQEPVRSRILALKPAAATVLAWFVEAFFLDRIESKPGFLVSMLLAGHQPPAELEQLVRLPVADWVTLAAAARDARGAGRAELPPRLAPHFEALYARWGRLDPSRWPILLPWLADERGGEGEAGDEAEEELPDAPVDDAAYAGEVWAGVLADLRTQMDPSTFNAWLKGSRVLRAEGRRWTVGVRSQSAVDWLERRLLPVVRRALQRVAGEQIDIGFEVEG